MSEAAARCAAGLWVWTMMIKRFVIGESILRHIFIINPTAGPEDSQSEIEKILSRVSAENEKVEVYHTTSRGDATRYVDSVCRSTDESLRFYACGGDGTLNEVVNGAVGFDHAAVGCYPCGSGNDFVKFFGGVEGFLDIHNQLEGTEMYIDLIRANGRYCVNVCSFGLDAAVADYMARVKNKLFFSGKKAYFAGVAKAFVKNMRTKCRVSSDGETLGEGDILLCTLANGSHVGSAFCCAPRAEMDDGLMEVCLVKPVARLRFATLVPGYVKGTHLDDPRYAPYIVYRRCSRVEVSSDDSEFSYILDGEMQNEKSFIAETVKRAIRFVVPRGLEGYLKNQEKAEIHI